MNKKGEIPIPYIVALIFAVIVLALLAYWLFFSGGEFDKMLKEKMCETKKGAHCSEWKLTGEPEKEFSSYPCSSITDANRDQYSAPGCCIFDWAGDVDQIVCGIE
jgi:hypothetical protein